MPKTKINRILLKLSGEALMGDDSYGIKLSVVDRIAMDIKDLFSKKIDLHFIQLKLVRFLVIMMLVKLCLKH